MSDIETRVERVEMTPELRKALYGLLPWEDGAFEEYTPELFQGRGLPPEHTPVFRVRAFTRKELNAIRKLGKAATEGQDQMEYEEDTVRRVTRPVLGRWDRLPSLPHGAPIHFEADESGAPTEGCYERLPFAIVMSLFLKATAMASLTEVEKRGFESPQASTPES